VIRWVTDKIRDRRGLNDAQKARVDNAGVLAASGMIAGKRCWDWWWRVLLLQEAGAGKVAPAGDF